MVKVEYTRTIQELYAFTEYSDARLNQEFVDTWNEQQSVKHGAERTAQLGRHMAHLLFELNCRLQEELEDGR